MRTSLPLSLLVLLFCATASAEVRFAAQEIDSKIAIGYGVAVADVDGDGKRDVLVADKNQIVWYRNPEWQKHVVAEKLTELDHVCIAAADIDGDGKAEIAVGAGWNPGDTVNSGSVHYLVPPEDRTQRWDAITLPHEPTVHRMRWAKDAGGGFQLVVVPLHGRGNKNGEGEGVKIMGYRRPSDPRRPWLTAVLDASLHMTHNFDPVEWDGDPAHELLVASKEGIFLFNRVGETMNPEPLAGIQSGGVGEVRLGKTKNHERFLAAIEPMHGNQLVVYREGKEGGLSKWSRTVLDSTMKEGHALGCGDLLGTGSDQIIAGWRNPNAEGKVGIVLYSLNEEGGWTKSIVDDNTMACEDLCLADVDGDSKLEIVASGRATKNVKIYHVVQDTR